MKKLFILTALFFTQLFSYAQDLEDINELIGKMKYQEAKEAIDKYLQNPKKEKDAEAWYFKGRIYSALSQQENMNPTQSYELKNEAFYAFIKNQTLDSKDVRLLFEGYNSYLILYSGFYDLGAVFFGAKNYKEAINSFKKAIDVKDYILSKKYEYSGVKLYALDTAIIFNIGICALQDKNEEEAVNYFKILADANVIAEGYKDFYEFVADYYERKNDEANLTSFLYKARKLYPDGEVWNDLEIKQAGKSGDEKMLFEKYEEMIAKQPNSFLLTYNYAAELYNNLHGKDAVDDIDSIASNKLIEYLKMAIKNEDNKDVLATVLLSNHLYNTSAIKLNLSNLIKGNKPADLKQKSALKSQSDKLMDDCIVYAERVESFYTNLSNKTPVQRANLKKALNYLEDIYGLKKNATKSAEYQKKNTSFEKF